MASPSKKMVKKLAPFIVMVRILFIKQSALIQKINEKTSKII